MLSDRLADKMGVKERDAVCLVQAPGGIAEKLAQAFPQSVRLTDYLGLRGFDHILWWPHTMQGFEAELARLAYCIVPTGSIWILMPKRQHAAQKGITFDWAEMQALALQTDLVDNKTVSFSDTDYATRFVIRLKHRLKYR